MNSFIQKKHKEKVEMFGNMDPIPAGVYSEIYKNTQMDMDGRLEIFQVENMAAESSVNLKEKK